MSRNKIVIGALVISVIGLAFFIGIQNPASTVPILGYSGPVAHFESIDHNYESDVVINTGTAISIKPDEPFGDLFDIFTSCGLRAELQGGVNVGATEIIDTIQKSVVDHDAQTNITENWSVQKVKCTMGLAVFTYDGGLHDTPGATFWIQLEENAFSVFQNTDESIAYMINVYTTEVATIVGEMEVVPTSAGYDFPLTSVGSYATPQWIIDSGYTDNLNRFKSVKFPIQILSGHPTTIGTFFREESSAQFYIGIDVLLFGYWEETKDYRDFDIPDPADFWEDLLAALYSGAWVIVGIILTVIAVWKIRGRKLIFLLIGIWAGVLFMGGFFAPFIDPFLAGLT